MKEILQVITHMTFGRFVLGTFLRDTEHQQHNHTDENARSGQNDMMAKECQGGDTKQTLN